MVLIVLPCLSRCYRCCVAAPGWPQPPIHILSLLLQQLLRDDLQATFFADAQQHYAEDFWLYVGEELDQDSKGSIQFSEIRFFILLLLHQSRIVQRGNVFASLAGSAAERLEEVGFAAPCRDAAWSEEWHIVHDTQLVRAGRSIVSLVVSYECVCRVLQVGTWFCVVTLR